LGDRWLADVARLDVEHTHPAHSLAISSLLGIIPIYTFMAATYDGSLAALLLVSIVLFLTWTLPMGLAKSERKAQ
jgi:hypothetical protein